MRRLLATLLLVAVAAVVPAAGTSDRPWTPGLAEASDRHGIVAVTGEPWPAVLPAIGLGLTLARAVRLSGAEPRATRSFAAVPAHQRAPPAR